MTKHSKIIAKWFFIRYTDKGYHLRLRLQGRPDDVGNLLVALKEKMKAGGYDQLIKDYQTDTYRREIERYGAQLILKIEDLFYFGSRLTAWAVNTNLTAGSSLTEFQLALRTASEMVDNFLQHAESKLIYLNLVTVRFLTEFKVDKLLKVDLDTKYREQRSMISKVLLEPPKIKFLSQFLKKLREIQAETVSLVEQEKYNLLADLVHMQLNRTFSVRQRQQEMLVYYCLQKFFISRAARSKRTSQVE